MTGFKSGARILIVEDETIIAMTAEDMVVELGGTVVTWAANVAAALTAVEKGGIDAAMLDINLNGEMSLPVAEALRGRGVPFIFTTGYGSNGPRTGFEDVTVLNKPYTMTMLETAFARLLPG